MHRPDIQRLCIELAAECLRVGAAAGAALDPADAEAMVMGMTKTNPEMGSSMLYDRMAKRTMEHDALTGAVVRVGAELGVPTPFNAAILALLCRGERRPHLIARPSGAGYSIELAWVSSKVSRSGILGITANTMNATTSTGIA